MGGTGLFIPGAGVGLGEQEYSLSDVRGPTLTDVF